MRWKTGAGRMVRLVYYDLLIREYSLLKSEYHLLMLFSQAAVVRGAALRGLEGLAPRIKHARRHYGIDLSMNFRESVDPESRSYLSKLDNRKLCSGRMRWFISKACNAPLVMPCNH